MLSSSSVVSSLTPGNGGELVVDALDADRGDGGAGHRRQQDAAQRITERQAEAALQGIDLEPGVVLRLLQDLHLGIELFEQFGRTSGRGLQRNVSA